MRRRMIGVVAILAAAPVAAEDRVAIGRSDCARLVRHASAADVAYTPGVDVHGRPVAPADLDGTAPLALPDAITVAVGVDLAKRLGLPGGVGVTAEAPLVKIVVKGDGRAYVDGRPLTSDEQAALAAACQRTPASR